MKVTDYGIVQSLIDTVGFAGSNFVLHRAAKELPNVSVSDSLVFLASDALVRNTKFVKNFLVDYGGYQQNYFLTDMGRNNLIALVFLIVNTVIDLLRSEGIKSSLYNNIVRSVVGLVTNTIIDKLLPDKLVDYK